MTIKRVIQKSSTGAYLLLSKVIFTMLILIGGFLCVSSAHAADYYVQGVLESANILSGATVTAISNMAVIASVPASTTVGIKFSQDRVNYYSSTGTKEQWDNCATGTTVIDLTGLNWSGGVLFYKLLLTTMNASKTPVVSEVQLNYSGTAVPAISGITYYNQGIVESDNILSGATVSTINSFQVIASLPPGTAANVKFSQDKINYYNASGTAEEWTALSNGTTTVNLASLAWTEASFYYKLQLVSEIDNALAPAILSVDLDYDGTSVPPPGNPYHIQGVLMSENLLAQSSSTLRGGERFAYNISSLPFGTMIEAQFSLDGESWYSSTGTPWEWDVLSSGDHLSPAQALDLTSLYWRDQTAFYYKLRFSSNVDDEISPVLADAGLTYFNNSPVIFKRGTKLKGQIKFK